VLADCYGSSGISVIISIRKEFPFARDNCMDTATGKRTWLLTWTTRGTWLPGDERGWVHGDPNNIHGTPHESPNERLRLWHLKRMKGNPVWLTKEQARVVLAAFMETAELQGWWLAAAAVMSNHIHLIATVDGDPDPGDLLRRFKTYSSRALNALGEKQTWWTASGSTRKLPDISALNAALRYVMEQPGALANHQSDNPGLAGL
jgi:REP element-mobilizing transposase RayT